MLHDEREIAQLIFSDCAISVGREGISAIKVYGENGMHCELPWFQVYKEGFDGVWSRVNAHMVERVVYKGEE